MTDSQWLAQRFEENREHLRAVAQRMLGPGGEADDAVQESWLRLESADSSSIENLRAWLTTVVARICLDSLRAKNTRKEDSLEDESGEIVAESASTGSLPEDEVVLADSVGVALMVVLDRLAPSERVAFVLHDVFGMSFDEIAQILDRTPVAARQLASRARRRVQGGTLPTERRIRERCIVEAFLSALKKGDFQALMAVLDPDLVFRADRFAATAGRDVEIHGAANWAKNAVTFAHLVQAAEMSLVDGSVGIILAPGGRLSRVLKIHFSDDRITEVEVIADPERVEKVELGIV
jgi:RNA polymerase sigma factor (sigma-70 family)